MSSIAMFVIPGKSVSENRSDCSGFTTLSTFDKFVRQMTYFDFPTVVFVFISSLVSSLQVDGLVREML